MKNLETKTEKNFTILGVDWKQWFPVYGKFVQSWKDSRDGKPSISTTDSDFLYWGGIVYNAIWTLGIIYGLSKLTEKIF